MLDNVRQLVQLIHERGFEPGDKLPSEREMSEMFGMSRGALREALIRLDTLRIVDARPKSGIYLRAGSADRSIEAMVLFAEADAPLAPDEVIQAVELRRLLETQAVRLACERRTDDDLERLSGIVKRCVAARGNGEKLAGLDAEFHLAIVAATQNDVFARFINVFYLMSRKRREVYFSSDEHCRQSVSDHRKLLAAIAERDVDKAENILRQHIKGVDVYFRTLFAASPDDGVPSSSSVVKRTKKKSATRKLVPADGVV
ncbi:FadR/GntR family transcriptional regulator [Paraburkholderia phytofirmans]|uniref:GntR domain protein n=1 Tax=Paraburkholderia phytofirmans (strain DSM 17436 / LMG 22146 / PsJN) TaxID=398527 RepID=B2T8V5_PARPJ|nr:FadR/GntR family transcriptional regulator [Paraburkholderia phytofirmans]ACD20768.1 GntR domain protein [Paraburkholderia phytofirmans PsJN]